jgi:hypothetical protein
MSREGAGALHKTPNMCNTDATVAMSSRTARPTGVKLAL